MLRIKSCEERAVEEREKAIAIILRATPILERLQFDEKFSSKDWVSTEGDELCQK